MFHSERMPLIFPILSLLFQEVKLLRVLLCRQNNDPQRCPGPLSRISKFVTVSSGCYNKNTGTGWIKQQTFISYVFEEWKSEIRVTGWLGSGESPLPSYWLPTCHSHGGRRARELCGGIFFKGTNPIMRLLPSATIIWELGFQHMILGRERPQTSSP